MDPSPCQKVKGKLKLLFLYFIQHSIGNDKQVTFDSQRPIRIQVFFQNNFSFEKFYLHSNYLFSQLISHD